MAESGNPDSALQNADVLLRIFRELDVVDLVRASEVSNFWREIALDDHLWRAKCADKWLTTEKKTMEGAPVDSFYQAYVNWSLSLGDAGPYYKRAKQCWNRIEKWLAANAPKEMFLDTLCAGATTEDIAKLESKLARPIPPAVKAIYRVHNGQATSIPRGTIRGIFGGYCFYDHLVCMHFTSLDYAALKEDKESIVVSHSLVGNRIICCSLEDGDLYYISPVSTHREKKLFRCCPKGAEKDGFLRWLEEIAKRMEEDNIRFENLISLDDHENDLPPFKLISVFPIKMSPPTSVCVTQGVEIIASPLFVPEQSSPRPLFGFTYSVRMRLLPGYGMETCQLRSRHWVITDGNRHTDEVRGEAVIGYYPLLKAGGKSFVYQSCTNFRALPGIMQGEFEFVPGSITDPTGPVFEAVVAPFVCDLPSYIF